MHLTQEEPALKNEAAFRTKKNPKQGKMASA
jgi:hypothetical protein